MFCEKCGSKISDDNKYCSKCGNRNDYWISNINNSIETESLTDNIPEDSMNPNGKNGDLDLINQSQIQPENAMTYCMNCGKRITFGNNFCESCGVKLVREEDSKGVFTNSYNQSEVQSAYNKTNSHNSKSFSNITFLSILIIFVACTVPIYDVWVGLIPDEYSSTFAVAMEKIFEDGLSYFFTFWPARFVSSALVPAILLFISSLSKNKIMCVLSSLIGLGFLLYNLVLIIIDYGFDTVIEFDSCSVLIGYWILLLLFVISLTSSSKKGRKNNAVI